MNSQNVEAADPPYDYSPNLLRIRHFRSSGEVPIIRSWWVAGLSVDRDILRALIHKIGSELMTGLLTIPSAEVPDVRPTGGRSATLDRARLRLEQHAEIWRRRPLVREIYGGYHQTIDAARSRVPGHNLELGAGHGSFAEFRPDTISSDIIPCPWLDCAADATGLPFATGSLSNIIMIDVLHHVADPVGFFDEARRTLAPGGRVILLEPYVSPVSWIAWKLLHEEDIDTAANPLANKLPKSYGETKNPWEANLAIPTLIFWKHLKMFQERFRELKVIQRERFDMLVMPLSGGFDRRRLIPIPLVPLARVIEWTLAPLTPLLAFRCFVVIEKVS